MGVQTLTQPQLFAPSETFVSAVANGTGSVVVSSTQELIADLIIPSRPLCRSLSLSCSVLAIGRSATNAEADSGIRLYAAGVLVSDRPALMRTGGTSYTSSVATYAALEADTEYLVRLTAVINSAGLTVTTTTDPRFTRVQAITHTLA